MCSEGETGACSRPRGTRRLALTGRNERSPRSGPGRTTFVSPVGIGFLLGAVLVFLSPAAHAAKDEAALTTSVGYAVVPKQDAQHGAMAEASGWFGLTDEIWLAGSCGASWLFTGDDAKPLTFELMGGLVVSFDVFRIVPFMELLAGLVAAPTAEPTIRVGLGADYFLTSTLTLGGVLRYRPLIEGEGDMLLSVSARLGWRFEL